MRPVGNSEQDTWGFLVSSNRRRLQMTQEDLATKLGTSVRTVSRWENGTARPENIALARKAIKLLGMDQAAGLYASGFGDEDDVQEDPYAYVRAMGLDPHGRVVRRILSLDISDKVRMAALRREKELQVLEEQRRLEDLEWKFRRDEDDEENPGQADRSTG